MFRRILADAGDIIITSWGRMLGIMVFTMLLAVVSGGAIAAVVVAKVGKQPDLGSILDLATNVIIAIGVLYVVFSLLMLAMNAAMLRVAEREEGLRAAIAGGFRRVPYLFVLQLVFFAVQMLGFQMVKAFGEGLGIIVLMGILFVYLAVPALIATVSVSVGHSNFGLSDAWRLGVCRPLGNIGAYFALLAIMALLGLGGAAFALLITITPLAIVLAFPAGLLVALVGPAACVAVYGAIKREVDGDYVQPDDRRPKLPRGERRSRQLGKGGDVEALGDTLERFASWFPEAAADAKRAQAKSSAATTISRPTAAKPLVEHHPPGMTAESYGEVLERLDDLVVVQSAGAAGSGSYFLPEGFQFVVSLHEEVLELLGWAETPGHPALEEIEASLASQHAVREVRQVEHAVFHVAAPDIDAPALHEMAVQALRAALESS